MNQVSPLHVDNRDGRSNTKYTVDEVFVDDVPPGMEVSGEKVIIGGGDDYVLWKYGAKPTVRIEGDGVYFSGDVTTQVQRQAYYALSRLDDMGLVSGFKEVASL